MQDLSSNVPAGRVGLVVMMLLNWPKLPVYCVVYGNYPIALDFLRTVSLIDMDSHSFIGIETIRNDF